MQDSLFTPLGMTETSWFLSNLDTNNVAVQYSYSSGYTRHGFVGTPVYPSGQLRTSSSQLAQHLMAFMLDGTLHGTEVLDSATVDMMITDQFPAAPTADPDHETIGLGWVKMFDDVEDWRFWGHVGSFHPGCHTIMEFQPDQKVGFVVLTNGSSLTGREDISTAIAGFAKDHDFDSVIAGFDNCPDTYNPSQSDADFDGKGDFCDSCTDTDGDGYGDPGFAATMCDIDNCPDDVNPSQDDQNNDGVGDACCCVNFRGNINGDQSDMIDISDLTTLVSFMFQSGPTPPCPHETDVNGDTSIDISDLTTLVSFMFSEGAQPNACP